MNPIQWLLIAAPATVIGAILFVGVFDRVDNSAEVQKAEIKLDQMEFDKQFADAWNGNEIKAPDAEAIENQRAYVAELKDLANKAKEQQNEQLQQFAESLTKEVNSGEDITQKLALLRQELAGEGAENE